MYMKHDTIMNKCSVLQCVAVCCSVLQYVHEEQSDVYEARHHHEEGLPRMNESCHI